MFLVYSTFRPIVVLPLLVAAVGTVAVLLFANTSNSEPTVDVNIARHAKQLRAIGAEVSLPTDPAPNWNEKALSRLAGVKANKRLWARDAPIGKKDTLKARGYSWSAGEFERPKCWYRDVPDADKTGEVAWLRENVMGPDQAVWALRITARNRYSDRCWGWGERLDITLEWAADRSGRR